METILESLLKEIITEKFFTEQERHIKNEFWTHIDVIQSAASIVASNISYNKEFMESVKDKLVDRFILLLDKWTIDEQIAKWVSEYVKNNMSSWDAPAMVSQLMNNIPDCIATQLISWDKNILNKIDLKWLTDKINSWNIEIKVTLKN